MKLSYIVTVLNEENTIEEHLASLVNQTRLPNEIIIVDGGSTDGTMSRIKDQGLRIKEKNKTTLIILQKKGNRSVGRNEAIKQARGDIIVISDAGCTLDKYWLENIVKPFTDKSVDVVAGYYGAKTKSIFEKCLASYVLVMPDKINSNNFLPATRSMAIKKSVWKKTGGFNETLSHNEDYEFSRRLKDSKVKIIFQKNAISYWQPRENLWQSFKMFFRFAFGDGESTIFRPKVILIFIRYILFFSFLSLTPLLKIKNLFILYLLSFILYLFWSIWKNFRYVKNWQAFLFLPILQITSDIAVMSGTIFGMLKSLQIKEKIMNNKITSLIIIFYAIIVLSGISWGVPNTNHPFSYHMDEWAQGQSIRAVFRHGTPNINGASHGTVFHYFLSGIYLIPFILLKLVNPLVIKGPFDHIDMQTRLFEILRLNTLMFGILSILFIAYVAKKILKINPLFPTLFFTLTPMFITLSNYFKYDIALIFWMLTALFWMLSYIKNAKKKYFLLSAIFSAIAVSVKLSAIPLLPCLFSCIFFVPSKNRDIKTYILGVVIFCLTFLLVGIPDIFISFNEYRNWFLLNVIVDPGLTGNTNYEMPLWNFLLLKEYPGVLGYTFYIFFILGIIFFPFLWIQKKKNYTNKYTQFLFICFLFFLLSILPLKSGGVGNRLLVLLPFLSLLTGSLFFKFYKNFTNKKIFILALSFCVAIQTANCLAWVSTRMGKDLRVQASEWIQKDIPKGTLIGLENIPIFQAIPDLTLKEFYEYQYRLSKHPLYSYQVIDSTSTLPSIIIISNAAETQKYVKKSLKNDLLKRLKKERYRVIARFTPQFSFFYIFYNNYDFYFTPLIASPNEISIFKQ